MRHGARLAQAASILKQLNALDFWRSQQEPVKILSIFACAQLAHLHLFPQHLKGTSSGLLLELLTDGSGHVDQTSFACATTRTAAGLSLERHQLEKLAAIIKSSKEFSDAEFLEDPCLTGWVYQLLLKDASGDLRANGKIAATDIGAATQWFTPHWVATFLVDETVGSKICTVTDPACGAGHLLVVTLSKMVGTLRHNGVPAAVALQAALGNIFGFDIDPFVIDLGAFAVYLQCRNLSPEHFELPIPQLLCWHTESGADMIGSLRLAGAEADQCGILRTLEGHSFSRSNLPDSFEVIVTNPPYLGHRVMPQEISTFLKRNYKESQYDLYAAFLRMASQKLSPGGRMGMICQQSFLSIQRYSGLRKQLNDVCDLEAIVQLGPGSFAAKAGEKVNNAIVVYNKRSAELANLDTSVRCWSLLEASDKSTAEQDGLKTLAPYIVPRANLTASDNPIAFWCPPEIAKLFQSCMPLQSSDTGIVGSNGLFTCDNKKFLRLHSEIDQEECHLYVPYDKGGGHKWFRTTPYMLRWEDHGAEIRRFRKSRGQASALPGEEHYFQPGVTYSYIGTRGFKARLLSPNSIFDIASSALFSKRIDLNYLVGFLNSSLACFMLGVLNPTINFQIGDLRRLPFIVPDVETEKQVSLLSAKAIKLAAQVETFDPSSPAYLKHAFLFHTPDFATERHLLQTESSALERLTGLVENINTEERAIQQELDEIIFRLFDISKVTRETIMADAWVTRSRCPLFKPLSPKLFKRV